RLCAVPRCQRRGTTPWNPGVGLRPTKPYGPGGREAGTGGMVRLRAVVAGAAAAGVLAGCGGPAQGPPQEQQPSIGEPATISPAESRSRPTTPVLTREGPCPYFGLEFAQQTIGQHLARSTVTTTRPYPGCTLYRP